MSKKTEKPKLKNGFVIVVSELLADKNLHALEKLILSDIVYLGGKNSRGYRLSNSRMAKKFGVCRRSIVTAIARLKVEHIKDTGKDDYHRCLKLKSGAKVAPKRSKKGAEIAPKECKTCTDKSPKRCKSCQHRLKYKNKKNKGGKNAALPSLSQGEASAAIGGRKYDEQKQQQRPEQEKLSAAAMNELKTKAGIRLNLKKPPRAPLSKREILDRVAQQRAALFATAG